jgi:hypothetical protein
LADIFVGKFGGKNVFFKMLSVGRQLRYNPPPSGLNLDSPALKHEVHVKNI